MSSVKRVRQMPQSHWMGERLLEKRQLVHDQKQNLLYYVQSNLGFTPYQQYSTCKTAAVEKTYLLLRIQLLLRPSVL